MKSPLLKNTDFEDMPESFRARIVQKLMITGHLHGEYLSNEKRIRLVNKEGRKLLEEYENLR